MLNCLICATTSYKFIHTFCICSIIFLKAYTYAYPHLPRSVQQNISTSLDISDDQCTCVCSTDHNSITLCTNARNLMYILNYVFILM